MSSAEPTRPIRVQDAEEQAESADGPEAPARAFKLHYAAVSDVGRVRKDNQDSGYAGPWLLTVCDGVGGAARGDIASSTAVSQIRKLDEPPSDDLLGQVAGALLRAHDRIGEIADEDPSLAGTSTTATVALFDGNRFGFGHIGDSRAYLLRDGQASQLTSDHTFVQSLIDEGRITEEEAATHPHRNLILKALDGVHDSEPDLFHVEVVAGDRIFLCSDGASGVLSLTRIADILSTGTPEYAAVEMVRASLDAGSTDNVTCLVADVVPVDDEIQEDLEPLLVGAAAELARGGPATTRPNRLLFRGHRSGDTGELEPVQAEIPDHIGFAIPADPLIDPEQARYAPQPPPRFVWARRVCVTLIGLGILAMAIGGFYWWTQQQYYIGEHDGRVAIYQGIPDVVPLVSLSEVHQDSNLSMDRLGDADRSEVEEGIDAADLDEARAKFEDLAARADDELPVTDPTTEDPDTPVEPSESTQPSQDQEQQQEQQPPSGSNESPNTQGNQLGNGLAGTRVAAAS